MDLYPISANVTEGTMSLRPLRRDAEENRERIVKAARMLFAKRGLEVTLDEIARHAGLGVGTIYRRFPNKESLIELLFERRVEEMVSVAHTALSTENSWEGFVCLLEGFLALEAEDRGLREVLLGSSYGRDRVARSKERIRPIMAEVVTRAQRDGFLRADLMPADIPMIIAMIGAVEEYCHQIVPGVWRRYLALVLDGLRPLRSSVTAFPVSALDDDQLRDAMRNWKSIKRT